jgi:hypothetical protein
VVYNAGKYLSSPDRIRQQFPAKCGVSQVAGNPFTHRIQAQTETEHTVILAGIFGYSRKGRLAPKLLDGEAK